MSRYRPRFLIGRGAMGEIWLGTLEGPEGFRRPVVVKRARDDEAEARAALVAEAHVASVVAHPNVVHVHELVKTADGLVLAMEYLSGLSVRALLSRLRLESVCVPWPIAARIASDAARGLHAAHVATSLGGEPMGIVHRDLSPENLVTIEPGLTKVLDFGIARSRFRTPTVVPTVKGKLAYLSPEQARGEPLDPRSDAFALGSVLVELLTGTAPFRRGDPLATVEAVLAAIVPPLPPDVPPALASVVRRLLARTRDDRPADLGAVADELDTIAGPRGRHRDVALFLRAEVGDVLAASRERLQALGSPDTEPHAAIPTRVTTLHALAGTMAALDPTDEGTAPDADELTEIDGVATALLLTKKKRSG